MAIGELTKDGKMNQVRRHVRMYIPTTGMLQLFMKSFKF